MKKKYRVLDTFCGAGGFSLGFQLAGCHIIGGIEFDRWAADTFQFNHKDSTVICENISKLSQKRILSSFKKPIDIVLGGPPCQGFSICTRNAGDPKDPRNSLFEEFLRIGRIFSPHLLIMENVPNLVKARIKTGKPILDIIQEEMEKLGYFVYSSILEATNFGIPQIRRRLFVVGSKKALTHPFPKPTHIWHNGNGQVNLFAQPMKDCPTLWDAISDLPQIEAREGAEEMQYSSSPQNEYQATLRNGSKKLWNHVAMKHGKRTVERFSTMSWGESIADVPEHLKPYKRNSNGVLAEKVYDQNNRRMYPHRPCHTIPASFYANFVHPYKNRNFTAREGARIQSFPDDFVFKGKPTVVSQKLLARENRFHEKYLCQYAQIGNAVPPLLSKALAVNLLKQMKGTL